MHEHKFAQAILHTPFEALHEATQDFIKEKALHYKLTFQETKQLIDMAVDFQMWNEGELEVWWQDAAHKAQVLGHVRTRWEARKQEPTRYDASAPVKTPVPKAQLETVQKPHLGLGSCPVASPKTRCCNLLTLDAVESCGFDCSYCSIQSFYNEGKIRFDATFAQKLQALSLDPKKLYHIGTGQSSDSLMWGNRAGVLEALFAFATAHPNVILELKTKSDNIDYLLSRPIPRNIITTWSLNPQVIIDHEERGAASLERRLDAAQRIAQKGNLVGFHFHPMVLFEGSEHAYSAIAKALMERFLPKHVAMVSLGTLTFIKPVIKKIRKRAMASKILQMPLEETHGKFSYTLAQKAQMFRALYEAFAPWHEAVFFYMCMEDASLWQKVFGFEYPSNDAFETAMLEAYSRKIKERS